MGAGDGDAEEEFSVKNNYTEINDLAQSHKPYDKVFTVLAALSESQVEYVIIGGFAMAFRGLPRFTQGLDLFVKPTEENVIELRRVLNSVFYDSFAAEITASDFEKFSVIRYIPEDIVMINFLNNIEDGLHYDDIQYDLIEINGLKLNVASLESLRLLKNISNCVADQEDLLFLEEMINRKSAKND